MKEKQTTLLLCSSKDTCFSSNTTQEMTKDGDFKLLKIQVLFFLLCYLFCLAKSFTFMSFFFLFYDFCVCIRNFLLKMSVLFAVFVCIVSFHSLQTFVLRVNIHCDGCKHKVKKLLQRIEGTVILLITMSRIYINLLLVIHWF